MKRHLEELQIDGLVSSSRENTTYLTDFLAVNYIYDRLNSANESLHENFLQTYGLHTSSGQSILVIPLSMLVALRTDSDVSCEVFTYGHPITTRAPVPKYDTRAEEEYEKHLSKPTRNFPTPELALLCAIKEFVTGKTIGVDYSDMALSSIKKLKRESTFTMKRANALFRLLRLVKSREEIKRLRHSAEVNERGLSQVLETAREGSSEMDLKRAYAKSVISEDADFDSGYLILASGTRSGSPLPRPTSVKLNKGSLLKIDVSCRVRGYFSDTGESGVVGKPSEKQLRIYNALREVVQRAEELAIPGVKCSELHEKVAKLWASYDLEVPPTGMGHGIGLEVHEFPRISKSTLNQSDIFDDLIRRSPDMVLEEGMVLNFEAPYLISGWGGLHLERTILINNVGSEPITNQDRHLRVI